MIRAAIRPKGDRERIARRFRAAPALAALAIGLNVSVPARADDALIEGCLKAAAEVHHVPAGVLVLLISVEGGRLGAVSQNANGTVDIGPMQVNDTWLIKIAGHWGASPEDAYRALRDSFCANVEGGAWILRQALDEAHGDLWQGVALYHSHDPLHKLEYMRLVYEQAMRLKREAVREATARRCERRYWGRAVVARSSRAGAAIGSDDYTGFSLILIVVGLCILGCASWQVWHAQISRIALLAAHSEMEAIGVVTDRFRPADIAVQRAHPDRVQFGQLVRLYRNIGQEFVYPAMALVLALAGLCFLRAGNARFTRTFDLEKLMAEQAIHSRSTAAFVGRGFKLSKLRAGEPRPADAALHADEWVARYATSEKSGFDEAAARREFMRQLGGRWMGPAAASEPVRCMLAVFALQGVQRRDEAAALLGLLSEGLPTRQSR